MRVATSIATSRDAHRFVALGREAAACTVCARRYWAWQKDPPAALADAGAAEAGVDRLSPFPELTTCVPYHHNWVVALRGGPRRQPRTDALAYLDRDHPLWIISGRRGLLLARRRVSASLNSFYKHITRRSHSLLTDAAVGD